MTDKNIELSRRKVLAGLGAVGAAGAGAGLGTSAYFSDEESFVGNTLSAGELDLLLDYQVKYHGGPGRLEDIQAMGYEDAEVVEDEEGTYLLEQVPEDGSLEDWQDYIGEHEEAFCTEYREDLVNGDEVSPIHLEDVKPGDSGCLTTSLHLCDNPAYVWMDGELVANNENGYTEPEPETSDGGDSNDPGEAEGEGELAESIQTRLWYDENCDCEHVEGGDGGDEIDLMLVLDRSGSMSGSMGDMEDAVNGTNDGDGLIDQLGSNVNLGLVSYSDNANLDQGLDSDHSLTESAVSGLTANGQTNIVDGVETAQDELLNGTNARGGAQKVMLVMSDGEHNQGGDPVDAADDAKDEDIDLYTVAFGSADQSTLQAMANGESGSSENDAHFFTADDEEELHDAFADIGQAVGGERVIFEGTLEELTGVLSTDDGIPLDGERSTGYDEIVEGDPADGGGEGREAFAPGETNCIGLTWELPTDVGNEVQTDSVAFDVGFYAEQERHNGGAGTEAET